MTNTAPSPVYEVDPGEKTLAPVIPINPIKSVKTEFKKVRPVSVKTETKKRVPDFTEPVFKPKKHDML